jgi:hypothetical protein
MSNATPTRARELVQTDETEVDTMAVVKTRRVAGVPTL